MAEARERAVAVACESSNVTVEAELLTRSLQQLGLDWERSWAMGHHLHPRDAAESLVRALGVEGAAREMVAEAFLGAGREVELELAPDIGACLEALSERGIRLGIVCDVGFSGGELLRELLDREGLLDHFSGWAFSDEVGHYKPAPQIFEAALTALEAKPEEAMHVGDLRRTDVAGAAAQGMRTVRYCGMNDEGEADAGPEAEFVVDSHGELLEVIARLDRG
jgi:putative hydrolase of the HAD superfamily